MKHFQRISIWLVIFSVLFLAICAVPPIAAQEGDVALIDLWNPQAQPNNIAEWRFAPADERAPDKYGIWPTADFTEGEAEISVKAIQALYKWKGLLDGGPTHDSLLILHKGKLIFEEYYNDYDKDTIHSVYSVTKSVVHAMVGIAIREGYFTGAEHKIAEFFPEVIASEKDKEYFNNITLEHLLTMTLQPEEYNVLSNGAVEIAFENPPGTAYSYDGRTTNLLAETVSRAAGKPIQDYASEKLFEPLGISSVLWAEDERGIAYGSSGIEMTPRDMLRFGYLYLNNGRWEDEQILPIEWVLQTGPKSLAASAYGRLFWNLKGWPLTDAYEAIGFHGQFISIFPSKDLVVVRTGHKSGFSYQW